MLMRRLPVLALSLTFAAALSLSSCGDKKDSSNPVAASTPTPVPGTLAPAPSPSPSPTVAPGSLKGASCSRLPSASGTDRDCRQEGSHVYEGALAEAMGSVSPQYMNGNEIISFSGFRDDIVKSLDAHGICGVFEADNLFMRGVGDSFNEYYDVITSNGFTAQRYTNTCRPPVTTPQAPPAPVVRDPTCKLPASIDTICIDGSPSFSAEMRGSIEAVIADERAKPVSAIFDFTQVLGGTPEGYKVKDADLYHTAVIRKLQALGFCAWYDGEEIQMKNNNTFSEHWDIYKAEGYRIQLFAGVCRDAAF